MISVSEAQGGGRSHTVKGLDHGARGLGFMCRAAGALEMFRAGLSTWTRALSPGYSAKLVVMSGSV